MSSKIIIYGEWYGGKEAEFDTTLANFNAQKIEKAIANLRPLYRECVKVSGDADGRGTFVFTVRRDMTFGYTDTYIAEVSFKSISAATYAKKRLSLSEVIDLFRTYCVQGKTPDLTNWTVRVDDGRSGAAFDYAETFICKYWQDRLDETDKRALEFAEFEALKAMFESSGGADAFYTAELCRLYEKRHLYAKIDRMFVTHSSNPIVAQIKGEIAYHGIFGAPDYRAAYNYFTHAMKIGSLLARVYLAKMYKYGQYVRQNYSKYVRLIRSTYSTYKKGNFWCCPDCLSLEMSEIEQREGNEDLAIRYCTRALDLTRELMRYVPPNLDYDDEKVVMRLYELVEFDRDEMDLLDLLYVLRQPTTVRIYLGGRCVTVKSLLHNGRLIVQCGDNYYRDAVDFLNRHKVGGKPLSVQNEKIDYMEVDDE